MSPKANFICTNVWQKPLMLLLLMWLLPFWASGQKDSLGCLDIPDHLHKGRFWTAAGTGIVLYTGTVISLNQLWYDEYPRTTFHTFNDMKEWQQMDKAGHMFTTYFEADWLYHAARWTGMNKKSSIIAGTCTALGLQTTLEVLDGFSSGWGFSWYDMAFNVAGAGLWAGQQAGWDEQRLRLKVSSTHITYPDEVVYGEPAGETTIRARTDDLFGTNIFPSCLKDYNAQTIWLSVNVHSFLKEESRFPKWLNLAIGYSGENMFGGRENKWEVEDNTFMTSDETYPRYRQFVLSPDIDLTELNVKSKPLRMLLGMANIFKFPAPAIVFNGHGGVKWDWLYY